MGAPVCTTSRRSPRAARITLPPQGHAHVVARSASRTIHARCLPILEPALIAPQLLLDADRRLVGARVGVGRHRFRLARHAGVEMDRALGAEAEAALPD